MRISDWSSDVCSSDLPCLQFPGPAARRGASGEGYVALYGHNFPEWLCLSVRHWARARGLPIRSIGYRNDWAAEQWLEAGPLEFAELMAGADAVVTNLFHGCVDRKVTRLNSRHQ